MKRSAKEAHLDGIIREIAAEEAERVEGLRIMEGEIPAFTKRLYMSLSEQRRFNRMYDDAFRRVVRANKRLYRLHMKAAKFAAELHA